MNPTILRTGYDSSESGSRSGFRSRSLSGSGSWSLSRTRSASKSWSCSRSRVN